MLGTDLEGRYTIKHQAPTPYSLQQLLTQAERYMPAFCLLAPVPLEHLEDGHQVCRDEGKVAFGSRAWQLFRDLEKLRDHAEVDVFIYASHCLAEVLEVSWRAIYVGSEERRTGTHSHGMLYRPPSTGKCPDDNEAH